MGPFVCQKKKWKGHAPYTTFLSLYKIDYIETNLLLFGVWEGANVFKLQRAKRYG